VLQVDEEITELTRLRELIPGWPGSNTELKVTDIINPVARRYIAAAPFLIVSTKASEGMIDVSPKGDPAGFVEVFDDKTLIIPDRLGNGRIDSFINILTDPNIGLLFIVPGHGDTLRVSGKARIVRDVAIGNRLSVNGKQPLLALIVDVEEVFMHCAKAFIRSHLWQTDYWPERKSAPTLAEWVVGTVDKQQSLEQVQTIHRDDEEARLY
jgi:PPOX class probable FMN-dependent enzyme